jgi:sterol desaturase/sphingolipid hydroxylase (fatty acid hydroxylase superfamily)
VGGHAVGALLFYCFHRFIFHGPLGKYPILKSWKALHTAHHASPEDPGSFFFPWWANAIIWAGTAALIFVVPAFALGMFSFFGLYAYRHRRAHLGSSSSWARHHKSHHFKFPRANFSGSYPIVDQIFGTYKQPAMIPIRVKNPRHE